MAYIDISLPTQPGAYWYRSERTGQEVLLNISQRDGVLIAWYLNQDTPVDSIKGFWRGPIPPSTGPGSLGAS